jgi:1-acyl-sn-glycerol-3-phosphate acyltransferase
MKKDRYSIKFYKGCRLLTDFYLDKFYNPKIVGKENLLDTGYLLVGNHKSGLDILLVAYALRKYNPRFMAKKEFFENPISKWLFEKVGAFPIDRQSLDLTAVKKAIRLLKDNNIVVIFPEGTRNTKEEMLPFKKGVASISMISNSKVVPFGISGDYKFRSKPTIEFGKAIDFKEESIGKEEADNYLQEKVKNLIRK